MKDIDIEKLRFISIEDLPPRKGFVHDKSKWILLFNSIPSGKAIVIPDSTVSKSTLRYNLKYFKKRGEYTNISIVSRLIDGERVNYVVNPK